MLNYFKKKLNIIFLIILLTIPFKINASTYDIFGLEFKINNTDFNTFIKDNINRAQLDVDFLNFIDAVLKSYVHMTLKRWETIRSTSGKF